MNDREQRLVNIEIYRMKDEQLSRIERRENSYDILELIRRRNLESHDKKYGEKVA